MAENYNCLMDILTEKCDVKIGEDKISYSIKYKETNVIVDDRNNRILTLDELNKDITDLERGGHAKVCLDVSEFISKDNSNPYIINFCDLAFEIFGYSSFTVETLPPNELSDKAYFYLFAHDFFARSDDLFNVYNMYHQILPLLGAKTRDIKVLAKRSVEDLIGNRLKSQQTNNP